MVGLRLIGFSDKEGKRLLKVVGAQKEVEGSPQSISVVSVKAVGQYAHQPQSETQAILWVPQGETALPFEAWCDDFEAQLHEDSKEGLSLLAKVARCGHVLRWTDRVEQIPAEWFAALPQSPRAIGLDSLPLDDVDKHHLKGCHDCVEELYDRLQQRAKLRWEMLCPSLDEIGVWLEGSSDAQLEAHAKECALCRETIQRQAYLWRGAELLTRETVDAKLTALGIAQAAPWITADLIWKTAQTISLVAVVAFLANSLPLRKPLGIRSRSRGGEEEAGAEEETKNSIALLGEKQWVSLRVEGSQLLLFAGESPSGRFERFRVEFRRKGQMVRSMDAENKTVHLTLDDFHDLQNEQVDQMVILV
jgi:hypothetical protein